MKKTNKRVVALHDLSSYGRCSLGVVIPLLNILGVMVSPVPTAVLSTHTGGFDDMTIVDLTDYLEGCLVHWRGLGLEFDAVYTGFLACEEQIDRVIDFFETYKNALKIVDPVMGDNGSLYKTYTCEMKKSIRRLVRSADIITPNLTEAALLLDIDYPRESIPKQYAKEILSSLSDLGPERVVVTSVEIEGIGNCNIGYNKPEEDFFCSRFIYHSAQYPGTGDIFASILTGEILLGRSLEAAVVTAADFIERAIRVTIEAGTDPREGIIMEAALDRLIGNNNMDYEIIKL